MAVMHGQFPCGTEMSKVARPAGALSIYAVYCQAHWIVENPQSSEWDLLIRSDNALRNVYSNSVPGL